MYARDDYTNMLLMMILFLVNTMIVMFPNWDINTQQVVAFFGSIRWLAIVKLTDARVTAIAHERRGGNFG